MTVFPASFSFARPLRLTGALTLFAALISASHAADLTHEPPPEKRACYVPVHVPAKIDIVKERRLVQPSRSGTRLIPPVYGTEFVRVQVEPEKEIWRLIPARYKTVREKVLVNPSQSVARKDGRLRKAVRRRVLVSPETFTFEWRMIKGKRTWCRVRHKAVYETRLFYSDLRKPNSYNQSTPAEYVIEERQVVDIPERRERYIRPARYKTIAKRVVLEAAREEVIDQPAEYETIAREVVVEPAKTVWRKVADDC